MNRIKKEVCIFLAMGIKSHYFVQAVLNKEIFLPVLIIEIEIKLFFRNEIYGFWGIMSRFMGRDRY